jgi:hypothetical protein
MTPELEHTAEKREKKLKDWIFPKQMPNLWLQLILLPKLKIFS